MCGIVAALPSYAAELLERQSAQSVLRQLPQFDNLRDVIDASELEVGLIWLTTAVQKTMAQVGQAGTAAALAEKPRLLKTARERVVELNHELAELDTQLDERSVSWAAETTEAVQGLLRAARDGAYGLLHDRIDAIGRAVALGPEHSAPTPHTMVGYLAVDRVLAAIDRLEVRGRDSAGVSVWIQLNAEDERAVADVADLRWDPLLQTGSVRRFAGGIAFIYKRSAVVGSLGANVSRLRGEISKDSLLHYTMGLESARVSVLAHTRWASVGRISEANAHPVDSPGRGPGAEPLALGALNGDIDNHRDLRRILGLDENSPVSTDAKLVPSLLNEHARTVSAEQAMARSLAEFDGSMAIAAQLSTSPDELVLAVKGSGQGLYVGVSETGYTVASEVYGLVATAPNYLRLDGGQAPGAVRAGTVVRLRRAKDGSIAGIERVDGDGNPVPIGPDEIRPAELTTRDLALGGAAHYLEKEIGEASSSFRKTLRSRVRTSGDRLYVDLPSSSLSEEIRRRLIAGRIKRLRIIGQGTAAVASQGIAGVMESLFAGALAVRAVPATEFSAYELETDLSDMMVVAISQSGSTTDTNRSVDLARQRGAHITAIINRRDSDLASKANGVLYTSDGRDVEMAVASTKAFYAQVAAGCLLGLQLGRVLGVVDPDAEDALLQSLQAMPAQLDELYRNQKAIADVASATVTRHQNWSVVGSGPNRVAAAEARIKLSELCYRAVSTDAIEDKKHIDLSAESLVLVCAAGAPPGQLRDLKKEVEIFSAHRNVPIVITDSFGDNSGDDAWPTPWVIRVPAARPEVAWILSTAAAHLFAYHAAASIDACADELRAALGLLEHYETAQPEFDRELAPGRVVPGLVEDGLVAVQDKLSQFVDRLETGDVTGLLTSKTVLALTAAALNSTLPPLGAPGVFTEYVLAPRELLRAGLSAAIDELTRSIDTVKHQAKTVTVGTSRDDAAHYANRIALALADAGCDPASALSHAVLAALSEHAPLTVDVLGVTRYRLRGTATRELIVQARTGVSKDLSSRADRWTPLLGSKELVARTRRARLLRGAGDGRLVLVLPEQEGAVLSGLAVVHLELAPYADGAALLRAAATVDGRVDELRAAMTEAGLDFDAALLAALPVEQVLLAPVESVAKQLVRNSLRYAV